MKATYFHAAAAIALTFAISACTSNVVPDISTPGAAPSPTPRPVATPAQLPAPTPIPVVNEPKFANYLDAPRTPGTWEYARFPFGSQALYNTNDASTAFALNCIVAERRIQLVRPVAVQQQRMVEIESETTKRTYTALPARGRAPALVVSLDPADDILDAMAITKGRFSVSTQGLRTLYIPAWVEVSRVIEDCRKGGLPV